MNYKILLVEDDFDFGFILKQYLELSSFEVVWFQDPKEVIPYIDIENFNFSIGILDIMMPSIDGFSLAKIILQKYPQFPLLFLTAKNQKIDRITGLKLGADDYITKPCDPEELVLRISNIIKRSTSTVDNTPDLIPIGSYIFTPENLLLQHKKGNIRMTVKEKELVLYFLKNNGKTIKREQLLEDLWDTSDYFSGRSLDVFISRLRKYFSYDDSIKIQSIRGVGFEIHFPK